MRSQYVTSFQVKSQRLNGAGTLAGSSCQLLRTVVLANVNKYILFKIKVEMGVKCVDTQKVSNRAFYTNINVDVLAIFFFVIY